MSGAELAARITAATATLGDFRRAQDEDSSGQQQPRPDWLAWAQRLSWALSDVLTEAGKAALTAGQRKTLSQALGDAVTYRRDAEADGPCPDCEPAALCVSHAWESRQVDAYLELVAALGVAL